MRENPTKSQASSAKPRYAHGDNNQFKSSRSALERALYVALVTAVLTLGRYLVDWQRPNDSYLVFLKGPLRSGGMPGLGYLLASLIALGAITPSRWILPTIGFTATVLWILTAKILSGLGIT